MFIKSWVCWGIYGGSPQKYLSYVGSEIKILKAKGSKKKKCAQKTNKSVRTVALSLHKILC